MWVLTWVGRILVNFIPGFHLRYHANILSIHVNTHNTLWLPWIISEFYSWSEVLYLFTCKCNVWLSVVAKEQSRIKDKRTNISNSKWHRTSLIKDEIKHEKSRTINPSPPQNLKAFRHHFCHLNRRTIKCPCDKCL